MKHDLLVRGKRRDNFVILFGTSLVGVYGFVEIKLFFKVLSRMLLGFLVIFKLFLGLGLYIRDL